MRFAHRFVPGFLPRSGLNHACACNAVRLGWAPLLRALLARRFIALNPSGCWRAIEVFLLSSLFEVCSPVRPWFPPAEWLESCLLCLRGPCFFLVLLGAASSRSLFARRFFVLRPCICSCALCFRLSCLKDVCWPFRSCISAREWLESCTCLRSCWCFR